MKYIDHTTYLALREGAKVLEADSHGEKVLHLANGNMLKLFRRKRLLSSSLWSPYAQRFHNNANDLLGRGIPAPQVLDVFRVRALRRDGVLYVPIPGHTLRHDFRANPHPPNLDAVRAALANFVHTLFERGIYFRSLHLGNIVRTPEGSFGLIDIADLRVLPFSLPLWLRRRNVERIVRISEPGESAWVDQASILGTNAGQCKQHARLDR